MFGNIKNALAQTFSKQYEDIDVKRFEALRKSSA